MKGRSRMSSGVTCPGNDGSSASRLPRSRWHAESMPRSACGAAPTCVLRACCVPFSVSRQPHGTVLVLFAREPHIEREAALGTHQVREGSKGGTDEDVKAFVPLLMRLRVGAAGQLNSVKATRGAHPAISKLDTRGVFLLDTGFHIFLWVRCCFIV